VESVSDEMPLKGVAEGDKAAMHIMFARHRIRVFRFIQRMVRNVAFADDLVSQAFLDVWRSANRFEAREFPHGYSRLPRLMALSSLRERTYENIDQDDVVGIVDAADTPEVALDRKETNAILRACIDQLSPAHREIIDLIYYHEQSIAEASVIVGIPHATVKSPMFYARKQLTRILASAGFEAAAVRKNVDTARETRPLAISGTRK
jgi:RNA polymerase sigma-70 factor, ECF subfamily